MNFFGMGRKKKRKKRQLTDEQKFRKSDLKIKRYAEKALVELADKDPEIKRQLVCETYGIKLPDPYKEPERKLKALMDDLVVQRIENEPEVARKIADAKIYQIMRTEGLTPDSEEAMSRPSSIRLHIDRFKEINVLKEVMGIKKPGFLEKLINPEVVIGVLSLIASVFGGKESLPATEEKVLVQINNEMKIISMSEFKRLQSEGRVQKTGEEESPGHDIQNIENDTPHELNTPDKTEGDTEPLQS